MIEKRFKLIKGVKKGTHSGIWDNQHYTGIGDELWVGEVVAMLNEGVALAEENKELKAEIEQSDSISKDIVCADIQHQLLKVTDENKELQKENEQLQRENNLLNNNEEDLKECTLENIQLKEENQELKRLIKKMGELGGFNKHLIKTICEDLE